MKEINVLVKKIKILYIVVIGLLLLLVGVVYYFQKKYDYLLKQTNAVIITATSTSKFLDNIIKLNDLRTQDIVYINNPKGWKDSLKEFSGLTFDIPKGWKLDSVTMKKLSSEMEEFTIILNKSSKTSFNDFAKDMYKKMYDLSGMVESFKEGRGYYEIKSFAEATYNNMYCDYTMVVDGRLEGPKVKVKLTEIEDKNQVKVIISHG